MTTITPNPPGYAVAFGEAPSRRVLPPGAENFHFVGLFDRGTSGQGSGVATLKTLFGERTTYSTAIDGASAAIVEAGGATWAAARVVGPAAAAAEVELSTVTITAKSVGAWANGATGGLAAQVKASSSARYIEIREGGTTGTVVATSPTTTAIADLVAWSDDNDYVTVAGASLPNAGSATNLAGGDDDRASITDADWTAAADLLIERYGPGILVAFDCDDTDAQGALLNHCDSFNRKAWFNLPVDTTKSEALTHIATMQTDFPDVVKHGRWFASWAYCTPIAGEPERLVPWSAIDAGIASRLIHTKGVATPTFGPDGAAARIVDRLYNEWTAVERGDLYAEGVNVAVDDGATIACWGYKSGDPESLHSDAHHQTVRMAFRFDAEAILRSFIGRGLTPSTLASLHGALDGLCQDYQKAGAFYTPDEGVTPGYRIDVENVNTTETIAARELHAVVAIKQTPTADWVDLMVNVAAITSA